MKGNLTLKILEFLEEGVTTAIDLATALSTGGSFNKVQREFGRRHFSRASLVSQREELVKKRKSFHSLIYKLKKDGLVAQSGGHSLHLTHRGKKKLEILKTRLSKSLPEKIYEKESDDKFKIVIFDIPEQQRHKRNWLRATLIGLDFIMLQKSVWFGKNKIPEDLLEDLEELELLPFVEIFEISKKGTIKPIPGK